MKERPILFSGAMVRALLAGTKTQTRRVVKMPDSLTSNDLTLTRMQDGYSDGYRPVFGLDDEPNAFSCKNPYGQPGDRLRVKEAAWMWCEHRPNGKTKIGRDKWIYVPMRYAPIHYAADHPTKPSIAVVSPDTGHAWGWRLKIGRFLPAWAIRITLEMTGARVERLQDISEADARAEGALECDPVSGREVRLAGASQRGSFVLHYRDIWESINGPGSWDANPWVWVIEFRHIEAQGGAAC